MDRTLRYFAWVAELIGTDSEQREFEPSDSIADILDRLSAEGGGYGDAFADRARLRFALDGEMAGPDTILGEASEVAIFPPVTGG